MNRRDFVNYLTDTLIPDLRESGRHETADDFARAVGFIENPSATEIHLCERHRKPIDPTNRHRDGFGFCTQCTLGHAIQD